RRRRPGPPARWRRRRGSAPGFAERTWRHLRRGLEGREGRESEPACSGSDAHLDSAPKGPSVRHLACLVVVPLLILAGCGPSLSVQRLTTDASGQEPVLQVWCRDAKRLDGHDVQVLVGWNRWLGTASVDATTVRPDGLLVV